MKTKPVSTCLRALRAIVPVLAACLTVSNVPAQPHIFSVTPASGSMNVSANAQVMFVFDDFMDSANTFSSFIDATTFQLLDVNETWSFNNTVLTCTPVQPWPAGHDIWWSVEGQNVFDEFLEGVTSGNFRVAGSSGTGGTGTNAITEFALGKVHYYRQNSAAAPILDPTDPYVFYADVTLASNRTANTVLLTTPVPANTNLTHSFFQPEFFYLSDSRTNLTTFDTTYPAGDYVFDVQGSTNQQVTLTLSAGMTQPNAPYVTNFATAQAIDPAQPFRLGWNPFTGGTANDFITVHVEDAYSSPPIDATNTLRGTNTSVLIPAGTLQPGTNYLVNIAFFRATLDTNNPTYSKLVFRQTTTDLTIVTTGTSQTPPLVLTNYSRVGGSFRFDVLSAAGQAMVIESCTNLVNWTPLLVTNSPAGTVQVVDPRAATNKSIYYRARKS